MSVIRVDPADLQAKARRIEEIADGYRGLAQRALQATQGAPSYDGQFGPPVRAIGNEAYVRLDRLAGRLSELSRELARIAEGFASADAAATAGLLSTRTRIEALFGSGFNGGMLSLLLPPHISMAIWNHLPPEDRLQLLLDLGLYPGTGGGPQAGTLLHVLNPLRVRQEAGLNGQIIAYATPGTEVTYTGDHRKVDGIEWYEVQHRDGVTGLLVTGWVSSYFLAEGKSRVGFERETVEAKFDIRIDTEVREGGGRLMSVTSDYLQISDGPTSDYAVIDAPETGRVVRWTGRTIETDDGHTWYEVTTWVEDPLTGELEAVSGWARADRVADYVPHSDAAPADEGKIWIELKQERSFSYYTVADIDAYANVDHGDPWLDNHEPVQWAHGIGPRIEVPNGALFSAEGIAMQGSGKVTVEGETRYIQLDNPRDLDWVNADGERTKWGEGSWTNGPPARIENPEDARFRWNENPPQLTSGVSVAGPPSMRGQKIWVPALEGLELNPLNPDGLFVVEDAGGSFPEGSPRFDLFFEDAAEGWGFYQRYHAGIDDGSTPVYIQQDLPPEIDEAPFP